MVESIEIKYWEDEDARDQGLSEIHDTFSVGSKELSIGEEEALILATVENLYYRQGKAAVEVIVEQDDGKEELWYHISDGEDGKPYIEDNRKSVKLLDNETIIPPMEDTTEDQNPSSSPSMG